jgi:hypothetical protein
MGNKTKVKIILDTNITEDILLDFKNTNIDIDKLTYQSEIINNKEHLIVESDTEIINSIVEFMKKHKLIIDIEWTQK